MEVDGALNTILYGINMPDMLTGNAQQDENNLLNQLSTTIDLSENEKDVMFNTTCREVAYGYAWFEKVMRRTGKSKFLVAMRYVPAWQTLSETKQKRIHTIMKYIKLIVENWSTMVRKLTQPNIILDVRMFPLWKLSKCTQGTYIEDENDKLLRIPTPPTTRSYEMYMVDDLVNNVAGSTERILSAIDNDENQLKLLAKDFQRIMKKRMNIDNLM